MFIQALFICLLANTLLVESTDYVFANVVRPKSLSIEDHNEQISKFWTDDRIKAAIPVDMTVPQLSGRTLQIKGDLSIGPQSSIAGSAPVKSTKRRRGTSSTGLLVATTGRVFWQVGDYLYSCSASVVSSTSGSMIATAGHCVYDVTSKTWYNNNNWAFVPAYSNDNAPYGIWPAESFYIRAAYQTVDYNADVAFVLLSTQNGQSIQNTVGAQGIGFNYPYSAYISSYGYPSNIESGEYLESCSGQAQASPYSPGNYNGQELSCVMGHGCSGGPWLQNLDASTGIGYVTSVNSFMIDGRPNYINGPYFDSNTYSLYNQANSVAN